MQRVISFVVLFILHFIPYFLCAMPDEDWRFVATGPHDITFGPPSVPYGQPKNDIFSLSANLGSFGSFSGSMNRYTDSRRLPVPTFHLSEKERKHMERRQQERVREQQYAEAYAKKLSNQVDRMCHIFANAYDSALPETLIINRIAAFDVLFEGLHEWDYTIILKDLQKYFDPETGIISSAESDFDSNDTIFHQMNAQEILEKWDNLYKKTSRSDDFK